MLNEILECGVNALAVNIIHYRDVGELGIQAKLGKVAFLHFPCWCHSPPRLPCWCHSPPRLSSPSILAHLPFLHLLLVDGRLWWPLVERPYCQQEEKTVIFEFDPMHQNPFLLVAFECAISSSFRSLGYHDQVKQEGPLPRVRDDSARIAGVTFSLLSSIRSKMPLSLRNTVFQIIDSLTWC